MSLSDREREILRGLEQQLAQEDPKLARTLARSSGEGSRHAPRGWWIASAALGVAALLTGLQLTQLWLGVLGFLFIFAALYLLLGTADAPGGRRGKGRRGAGRSGAPAPRAASPFMKRLEERWDSRRRGY